MKNNFLRSSLLLLLLVFPVFAYAQTIRPDDDSVDIGPTVGTAYSLEEQLSEIDAYAQKVQKDWNVPGMAIAIVKDDKVVFAKGYGVQKIGTNDRVDENTLFAIASNSKAFTTASLAMLIDEGKIGGWDDKVSKYLPEFELYNPYVTSDLTIRDLVSHRVGLDTFSGDLLWYETTYSSDEVLKRLKYLKPVRGFRSGFGYQNLMFIAAGRIVEKVSGKSWGEFVSERILKPLNMNRTTTSIKDIKDNAAFPHNESGGKGLHVLQRGNVDNARAAAGLNSSVADIANWLRLQLNDGKFDGKQIVSEKNMWEMHQPDVILPISKSSSEFIPSRHFNTYGLGWNIFDYQGRKVISHGGGLDGMISRTSMMPEENLGLVILTNSETSVATIMQYKIYDVFVNAPKRDWSAEYKKFSEDGDKRTAEARKKLEDSRKLNTKTSLDLKDYAGTYSGELYGDATVSEENGKLVLRLKPAPNFVADLEHWHYDTFKINWRPSVSYNFPPGFVTFTIDKNGKADELKIDQPNNDFWFYELEFKRVEMKANAASR
jgi:CubicO group peptidase (beta-lactamase class C family)